VGLTDLDNVLDGIGGGELTLVAGRPGMGKAALGNVIGINMARMGARVLVVDLEMSEEQQMLRRAAMLAGVDAQRWRRRELSTAELGEVKRAARTLGQLTITVRAVPEATPATLDAMIAHEVMMGGVDVVIVDHAGKKAALRHSLPVIALMQLNRAAETRQDKRPMLSDLRDSGSWEQDADNVLGLYRDEYYNEDTTERPNILEVLVLKNRNGATGTVDLYTDMRCFRITNLQAVALNGRYGT